MTYGCSPQLRDIGLNDRAPACEPVKPQPNRNTLIRMDGEHLCGVAVPGSEERRPGLCQCRPGLPPTGEEACVNGLPVGEQGLPACHRGLPAHEKHQPGRIGRAGPFGVRVEITVAESCEARAMRVPPSVTDDREAVRFAVTMRYKVHDPVGHGEHGVARGEAIEGGQSNLPQLRREHRLCPRRREVNAVVRESVGVRLIGSAHHGSPSLRWGAPTVRSHWACGKATDCRLGQFAH